MQFNKQQSYKSKINQSLYPSPMKQNILDQLKYEIHQNNKRSSDYILKRSAEEVEEGKQGLGKVGRGVFDVAKSTGDWATALLESAATLGTVNPLVFMGLQDAGQSAYSARQKGANIDQQIGMGSQRFL